MSKRLGMDRAITRRDFLNGFAVAVGGSLLAPDTAMDGTFGLPHSPLGSSISKRDTTLLHYRHARNHRRRDGSRPRLARRQ